MCPPGQRLCYFASTRSRRQNDAICDTFRQIWAHRMYATKIPQRLPLEGSGVNSREVIYDYI